MDCKNNSRLWFSWKAAYVLSFYSHIHWFIKKNFNKFLYFYCFPEKCLKTDIVVANGFLSESEYAYSVNKETQYKCKPGYTTADGKTSGTVQCLQGGWSSQPTCISK